MPLCPAQLQRWRLAFETAARPRGNNKNRWRYCEGEVNVVKAKNQTVEDIYRLVCAAIANKQPIRGHLKGALPSVLPSPVGSQSPGPASRPLFINRVVRARAVGAHGFTGGLALRRFRETSRVELLNDSRRTARNHSRPTTCVMEADIDAEDQPDRDPQKGQGAILPIR